MRAMNRPFCLRQARPLARLVFILILSAIFTVKAGEADSGGESARLPQLKGAVLRFAANSIAEVSGTYNSVVISKRGKRRTVIRLVQNGNEITGTLESRPDDRISGTRSGDTIKFLFYRKGAGYDLLGRWKILADGVTLEGRWERPDGAFGGKWVLTRIE